MYLNLEADDPHDVLQCDILSCLRLSKGPSCQMDLVHLSVVQPFNKIYKGLLGLGDLIFSPPALALFFCFFFLESSGPSPVSTTSAADADLRLPFFGGVADPFSSSITPEGSSERSALSSSGRRFSFRAFFRGPRISCNPAKMQANSSHHARWQLIRPESTFVLLMELKSSKPYFAAIQEHLDRLYSKKISTESFVSWRAKRSIWKGLSSLSHLL
jgi:hypothetical protein